MMKGWLARIAMTLFAAAAVWFGATTVSPFMGASGLAQAPKVAAASASQAAPDPQNFATANPGNRGGALVNLQGQVVGINTLIAGMAEPEVQAQGIGLAIAINTVKPIADQLVATGKVVHPFVGISYTGLTPPLARQLGVPSNTKGIVVAQVVAGSPAAQAGLQQGDVITQVDNQPITDDSTLGRVLATKKPGDTISLTVQRGGQSMQVSVTLAQRPAGT